MSRLRLTLVSLVAASLLNLLVISIWTSTPPPAPPRRDDETRAIHLAGPKSMAAKDVTLPPARPVDTTSPPRQSDHATIDLFVQGPAQLERGANGVATVVAMSSTSPDNAVPAANVPVTVELLNFNSGAAVVSSSGVTGADGRFEARFFIPSDLPATTKLSARTTGGDPVSAVAPARVVDHSETCRVLLVTDKPVYQPGQVIHLRSLALDPATLHPASGEVLFEVEDSKGNKVFKKRCDMGDHGVATADFQLADEVLMGDYRISATSRKSVGEKSVSVRKYVLPKYKVAVGTDRKWYLPKETVKGTIHSDYFFGKPVAGADVTIKAATFDAVFREFAAVTARTDDAGAAEFEIKLPDYFAGQPLDRGNAYVRLEVTVKDSAGHEEKSTMSLSVANRAIKLAAVPESGKLVQGVENTVFVVATAPDGEPVACDVEMTAGSTVLKGAADATGVAELRFIPAVSPSWGVTLKARDAKGNTGEDSTVLQAEQGRDRILLRLDRAMVRAGERIGVEALGTFGTARVFVDAIRDGRAVFLTSCDMKDGRASTGITIPPGEFGAMEVHAYAILANGDLVRDTRVIHVDPANDLKIEITPDRASWRPGETATIDFQVTGADGSGAAAALGVVVVDESVYAVQDLQPGLEKVFFTLARELQEPRYGIKIRGGLASVVSGPQSDESTQRIARTLLAAAEPPTLVSSGGSGRERRDAYLRKQALIWRTLEQWILTWKETWYVRDSAEATPHWQPHLLRRIAADPRIRAGNTLFTDPWGNEITMESLEKQSAVFTIEWWGHAASKHVPLDLWKQLVALGAKGDLFRDGFFVHDPVERLKAAGLESETLQDIWSRPVLLDSLRSLDPAFERENLLAASECQQRAEIFNKLVDYVERKGGVTWRYDSFLYDEGIVQAAGLPEMEAVGRPMTAAALSADRNGLSADNVVHAAQAARNVKLAAALKKYQEMKGWAEAVSEDGEKWRPGLEQAMRDLTLLEPCGVPFAGGSPYTLQDACFLDRSLRPLALSARLTGSVAAIATSVCQHIHNGAGKLTEDSVEGLARDGRLADSSARDPWGAYYRVVRLQPGEVQTHMGCGLLDGQMKVISAGPDRKFGTADDLRVDESPSPGAGIAFAIPAALRSFVLPKRVARATPPEFEAILRQLSRGGSDDEPMIYFPDAEESDHNESSDYTAMKGDSMEFLSAMPGEGGGIRGRAAGVYDAMGVGGGGGGGGRYGSAMGGASRRNLRAGGGSAQPAPPEGIRVREWFPETLCWKPLLITDSRGHARLEIPLADSITTWRMTATASSAEGRLGSATAGLLVFQPFFADIDFPVALTQNDEVEVPVAVYNYLKEPQDVNLQVDQEDWFELKGSPRATLTLQPGDVRAAHFRIKVKGLGRRRLTVYAWGADESARDAIRRDVEIVPDGQMVEVVLNSRLDRPINVNMALPTNAIPGTTKIFAKVYPGVLSQVVEGVEGLLGMPHG